MFKRVAIIGLGLIGGSIGLALQQAKVASHIVGYDMSRDVIERALKIGAIDQGSTVLTDTVHGADFVILATPVGAMEVLFQTIASALSPGVIVTDVASTKTQVINWAEAFLPPTVKFVGGHPMAGKESSGVEAADAALFHNCIYCLTPTPHTQPAALNKVLAFVEVLGARVRFLAASEHDEQVAGVSHLPFLASTALMNAVADDVTWDGAATLAASGFRDVSRLAAGNPIMYRDICLTNSEAIIRKLDTYIEALRTLREHIATHDKHIDEIFSHAQQSRQQWQSAQNTPYQKTSE